MKATAEVLDGFRRKIARIRRRALARPGRSNVIVIEGVGPLLTEIKRLGASEPETAFQSLLLLLDHLGRIASTIDDDEGLLGDGMQNVLDDVRKLVSREMKADRRRLDAVEAIRSLFRQWVGDQDGLYPDFAETLLSVAVDGGVEFELLELSRQQLLNLPLVFPAFPGLSDDLPRMIWIAERHQVERLVGELLARADRHEYAIIVARDYWRRSGDAIDLVEGLARAGRGKEAVMEARKALASPHVYHRKRLQDLLDELREETGENKDRRTRKTLENEFLSSPCLNSFRALKSAVQEEQWPQVRKRVLGHLHKHQKSPSVLFSLYLEEGELLEADGLVVTQPVDAETLEQGASLIGEIRPDMAAGWLLSAAHRRAGQRRATHYQKVVRNLLQVRDLADSHSQVESLSRAINKFRTRYARRTRLIELMDEAGLV